MIKDVINATVAAARSLLRNWRALIIFFGLYILLLVVSYLFLVTREASIWQVLLTFLLAIAAPVIFFIIQAMGVSYSQRGDGAGALLRRSLGNCWKLILISLPIILIAWLFIYLLGRIQPDVTTAVSEAARAVPTPPRPPARAPQQSIQWQAVLITTLRFLLLYIALPLAAIHLWIATSREGIIAALKGAGRILARAFAPRAVLIYVAGLIIFALIPYLLIFTRTPSKNAWLEIALLGARLALALVFILFGWVVTLGALSGIATESK